MSVSATCPNCDAKFQLGDELAGKRVKCRKCSHVFTLPAEDNEDEQISATPPKRKGPPPPPSKNGDRERSRPKIRRKESTSSGSGMLMIVLLLVLGGGGLVSCLACVGAIGWVSFRSAPEKPMPIAQAEEPRPVIDFVDAKDAGNKDKFGDAQKKPDDPFGDRPKFDKKVIKDGPFLDKKAPPPVLGDINVVFAGDGSYRNDNTITDLDPRNRFNKKHKLYLVPMEQGRTYQIDLTSGAFDSYLYLYDATGKLLAQDDDGGGYPSARIIYRATRNGVFRVEATSLGGQFTGPFRLAIRRTG